MPTTAARSPFSQTSASAAATAARMAPESNAPPNATIAPERVSAPLRGEASPASGERLNPVPCSPARQDPLTTPPPATPPQMVTRVAEDRSSGLGRAQVEAIKAALQGQRFLWSMVEHATRWEIEGAELRLFFPSESRALAEMLQARDPMERLRTVLNQVVGQPLRVCVKLDGSARPMGAAHSAELRSRFEEDPIVRAMLEKFGGQISRVKRPGEE